MGHLIQSMVRSKILEEKMPHQGKDGLVDLSPGTGRLRASFRRVGMGTGDLFYGII